MSQIQRHLDRIGLPPGYEIAVAPDGLVLTVPRPDVDQPDSMVAVTYVHRIDPAMPIERNVIIEVVRLMLMGLWEHEIDEWLTYDGKRVRNPHPSTER